MIGGFKVGEEISPLVNLTDEAATQLAALIKAAFIYDAQTAWAAATAGSSKYDGYVINQVLTVNPQPYITRAVKLRFPLLAVYREQYSIVPFAIAEDLKTTDWNIFYVLPQATPEDLKFDFIRTAFFNTVQSIITRNGHPGYLDGYSGILGEGEGNCGFWSANITSAQLGEWTISNADDSGDGIIYPTIRVQLQTTERASLYSDNDPGIYPLLEAQLDGYAPLDGYDYDILISSAYAPLDGYDYDILIS